MRVTPPRERVPVVLVTEMPGFSAALSGQLRGRGAVVRSYAALHTAADAIVREPPAVVLLDQRSERSEAPAMAAQLRRALAAQCPRLVLIARHRVPARLLKELDAVIRPPVRVVEVSSVVLALAGRGSSSRSGTRLKRVASEGNARREVVVLSGTDRRRD